MATNSKVFDMRSKGAGWYVAAIAAVAALAGLIGNVMLGSFMSASTLLLVIGILLFAASSALTYDLVTLAGYCCYVAAMCCFISEQLYTISNVLTAIDASSFPASFLTAAIGMVAAVVLGLVSVILPQNRQAGAPAWSQCGATKAS